MELLDVQLVLIIVVAAIGLTINVIGKTAYHGIRIYLMIKEHREKKQRSKVTKPPGK